MPNLWLALRTGCNSLDDYFERIEGPLGVLATEDEPLSNLLPGMRDPLDVLLVDDPLPMDEDVALLKHDLEPRPDVFRHVRRDRDSNVL